MRFLFVYDIVVLMKPVTLLKKLSLLNGEVVLDVGARNCSTGIDFINEGFTVDAIDVNNIPSSHIHEAINFEKISFEEFSTEKKYDVIIARHVLPFLTISIESAFDKLCELLREKGVLYFSVFGNKDGWYNDPKVHTSNLDEVREMVKKFGKISYESEEFYEGSTYSGDIKNWHIITMVVIKK